MEMITEEQFDERFTLIDAPDGQQVWEKDQFNDEHVGANRIWSLMDGDEGGTYMVSGVHWVNVYGFHVTKEEHDFSIEVEIESEEEEKERHDIENHPGEPCHCYD